MSNEGQYYEVIDPYIQEAAVSLSVIKHLLAEKKSWHSCYDYKGALIDYNVSFFNTYIRGRNCSEPLHQASKKLHDAIARVKEEAGLSGLNIMEELTKTMNLFKRANVEYYKCLSVLHKLKLKMLNIF